MGYKHTPIETSVETNKDDPAKTEMTLKGGQTIPENKMMSKPSMSNVTTDPEDPTKTVATLTAVEDDKQETSTNCVVAVIGDFSGMAHVSKGTLLKEALMQMVKEDGPSYGSFKYRDENDAPVGISTVVEKDMNLKSLHKG